jgi:solute carrier family 25 protein 14/30
MHDFWINSVKPAILRQATYGTLKLGFYQIIKKKLARRPGEQSLFNNVVSGMVSGATAMSTLIF